VLDEQLDDAADRELLVVGQIAVPVRELVRSFDVPRHGDNYATRTLML
jgi:hypothetical protein